MTEKSSGLEDKTVVLTTEIVCAYVANNPVPERSMADLIKAVHGALLSLASAGSEAATPEAEKPSAAQIRKSISPDALVSFIDGKSYQTLKRHLTRNGLNPHEYRQRFGLPSDYPMTAPGYSARRSELARSFKLGRSRSASARAHAQEGNTPRKTSRAAE